MNQIVAVTHEQISDTVHQLKSHSAGVREAVVLWLAERTSSTCVIRAVFVPLQETGVDFFSIPPAGIRQVLVECRRNNLFVAAQLHTHPFDAYHSEADDELALIRHRNALSFVFPNFASEAASVTFSATAALYRLSDQNAWEFVPEREHSRYYEIR
jgi:proteasome lid subunit RPN8/RPN11